MEYEKFCGKIVSEIRRFKFSASMQDSRTIRVGLAGITLIDFEIHEEDLDRDLDDVVNEVLVVVDDYLNDKGDDIPEDLRITPVLAEYLRRKNLKDRSSKLIDGDATK